MKRALLLSLPLLLAACPSPAKKDPTTAGAGAVDPLDRVRYALKGMRAYRARLVSTMNPSVMVKARGELPTDKVKVEVVSELAVALPDRMNQKVLLKNPEGEMRVHLIFTGEKVWAGTTLKLPGKAVQGSPRRHAVSFEQKTLASQGRPFDVGYTMRGHGLDDGEDLVGTVLAYLERYRFKGRGKPAKVGEEPCLLFTGELDREAAVTLIFSRPRTLGGMVMAQRARDEVDLPLVPGGGLVGMAADVIKGTAVIRLWVSTRDHLPRRWTLGDGEDDLIDVRVEQLESAAKHGPDTFTVTADQLKQSADITAHARTQLKQAEDASEDEATVRRLKETLEELLK